MVNKGRGLAALAGICLSVGLLVGCGGGSTPVTKKAPSKPKWELNLTVDGAPIKLPLEIMDVNLVEDDGYAETFEIRGPSVTLVGSFPLAIHVDYGENCDVLKGQAISISPTMNHPSVAAQSFLDLPNLGRAQVTGGSFTVDKVTGEFAGSEGDITLSGNIKLDVKTTAGAKSLTGTFAVHGVTWG